MVIVPKTWSRDSNYKDDPMFHDGSLGLMIRWGSFTWA